MRRLATTFLGGIDTHGCLLGALHLCFSFFSSPSARQTTTHHPQRGKRGQYATQTEALGLPLLEISTTLPLTSKARCGFPPCSCQVRVSESQLQSVVSHVQHRVQLHGMGDLRFVLDRLQHSPTGYHIPDRL